MPTSNKSMSNLMRKGREDLSSYMYQGDAPEDVELEDPLGAELPDEMEGAAPEDFTVLAAGDTPDPEMYVYELEPDRPGAWLIYPPGVPCESGGAKIQRSSPASAAELTEMETALMSADPGMSPSTPSLEGAY